MKIAFLFPGQGSQVIGMGKDIYEKYKEAKIIYDKVKEITGIDIAKISFEGPEEVLNKTQNTQLAVLTMSLAIIEILKNNNINAEISTGLSLGEYSALIYSKALELEKGIDLVKKRGEYMQNLAPKGDWSMAAIMGMSEEQIIDACNKVKNGFVVPANFNNVSQIVISGEKSGVEEAVQILKEMGARKAIVLNTAGPFHTEKLKDSSEALRKELDNVDFNKFKTKVVKNIDGKIYNDKDDMRDILARHIVSPVRFDKSIETMLEEGVDTFVEIGPGKTLSGFVKRTPTDKQINIYNINNVETLENVIEILKK
ncbi:MAG: ACP S-malonyltransferase [Clostridia bacterium]|nr:ACP S-malonyltransferase [Clostridia bacterium]